MSDAAKFDYLLADDGPAALVLKQHLTAVEGPDGVVFPATYAGDGSNEGGYNIDTFPDGKNVALVDSVGSQANRIEPIFKEEKYRHLAPQIIIKAGEKDVSVFDAGHRAGDAILRCSSLQQELQEAFKAALKGDHEPMAKIAPTSLVFGVWDSRDTQAKMPRLISSTIRAYNVRKLTRSAQYVPAARYIDAGLVDAPVDKGAKDAYSVRGFLDVPATGTHGGVIAESIRRDATLALAALRLLRSKDEKKTKVLRRYILGLALTAFTYQPGGYLRQGCLLVLNANPSEPHEFAEVYSNGERKPAKITHEQALQFATAAAKEFGIGQDKTAPFESERARKDVSGDGEGKKAKKAK
jgi:CRISPR-associated protein Csb1